MEVERNIFRKATDQEKEYDLKKLVEWSKAKIVPLDYEGTIIALSNNQLEGEVISLKDIIFNDFKMFIKNLIKDLLIYAKTDD